MKQLLSLLIVLQLCFSCTSKQPLEANVKISLPGDDLQARLDKGENLYLKKGEVYPLKSALKFKHDNQQIKTFDAVSLSEYAILRPADESVQQLVNGNGKDHILLKNVMLDGYRRYFSGAVKIHGVGQPPLAFFGGNGANYQTIEKCVFMDTRTWSTLKVHEGGQHCHVLDNIILGAGVGPRGNGRESREKPFAWGDGITCAAEKSLISNNLIIDATDVGAVLFGAPGSIAKDNVIATVSRESLGGLNLVDPIKCYKIDETRTDYRGSKLLNNYIDAYGGRIHIAFPMGAAIWVPNKAGEILYGAEIRGNTVAGDAAAYGFIAHGVEKFTIVDNKSTATYSGLADGLGDRLPEKPGAFIFDQESVVNCDLQDEFVPSERHVTHLLRCNHGPVNELGYRVYPYGDDEIAAVVNAAFEEMLGRKPLLTELTKYVRHMQKTLKNSDWLRRDLMNHKDFKAQFGKIAETKLQMFRWGLWLHLLNEIEKQGDDLSAMETYKLARKSLLDQKLRSSLKSQVNKYIESGFL